MPCRIQNSEIIRYSQTLGLVDYYWMLGFQKLDLEADFDGLIARDVLDNPLDWKAFCCHSYG
jgi:hypothetical protein